MDANDHSPHVEIHIDPCGTGWAVSKVEAGRLLYYAYRQDLTEARRLAHRLEEKAHAQGQDVDMSEGLMQSA